MATNGTGPSKLHLSMIEVLKAHPEGLTEGRMRTIMKVPTERMAQFGRRRRELNRWFDIRGERHGNEYKYFYRGERAKRLDADPINNKLRAEMLARDHRRCQMCGRTPSEDGVKLHIDHKIPRNWGGKTEPANLWTLCTDCNEGKKDHFATFDSDVMKQVVSHDSVHVRLGELLKLFPEKAVPSYLLEAVANAGSVQEDWHKRLRELRYLGWQISASRSKSEAGYVQSAYKLETWEAWPDDPSGWLRRYESQRRAHNKLKRG